MAISPQLNSSLMPGLFGLKFRLQRSHERHTFKEPPQGRWLHNTATYLLVIIVWLARVARGKDAKMYEF